MKDTPETMEMRFKKELTCDAFGHECCGLAVRGEHQEYIDFIKKEISLAISSHNKELVEKILEFTQKDTCTRRSLEKFLLNLIKQ